MDNMKHLMQLGSTEYLERGTSIPINGSVNDTGKNHYRKKFDHYVNQKTGYHESNELNYLQVMDGANILANNSHGKNFEKTENIVRIFDAKTANNPVNPVKSREGKCGRSERVLFHKISKNPKDIVSEKLVLKKKLQSESKVPSLVYDVKESWHNKNMVRSGAPKDGKVSDFIMFKEKLAKIKSNFFGETNHKKKTRI
jgi:hypothetical protein